MLKPSGAGAAGKGDHTASSGRGSLRRGREQTDTLGGG